MKKTISLLLITAMIAAFALTLTGCGSKTINLNDYFTYEIEGYDGYGSVSSYLDWDRLETKLTEIAKTKKASSLLTLTAAFEMSVDGGWSQYDTLSNGDSITYHWDVDKEYFKEVFNINLNYKDITVKVKDLKEVSSFDPFEGLDIDVQGTSPNGSISLSSNKYSLLGFYADKSTGLSSGDVVTIKVDFDPDYTIRSYGGVPARTEMTYTIEALDEYISSLDKLPEALESQILNQVDDFIVSNYADNAELKTKSYDIIGYYLLSAKGEVSSLWNPVYNQLYVVYKTDIEYNSEDVKETVTAYKYVKFKNIIRYADGTGYVNILDYENPTYGGWFNDNEEYFTSTSGQKYAGYKDLATFENQCITSQKAEWNVETNIH